LEPQSGQAVLDLFEIDREVLTPQRRPLAHGDGLGRLEVGEPQCGQVAVLGRELAQRVDHVHEFAADLLQARAQQDQVGVVGDVRAGRAQVDDRRRLGRRLAEGVNMGHHVVAHPAFVVGRLGEIDVVQVAAHRLQRRVGHLGQPELALRLGQRQPEPAPSRELGLRAPQADHFLGRVALNQRMDEAVGHDGSGNHGIDEPSPPNSAIVWVWLASPSRQSFLLPSLLQLSDGRVLFK